MKKDMIHIIYILLVAAVTLFTASCTVDEDINVGSGDGETVVRFRPSLERNIQTRTIGDGTGIDELVVAVFEDSTDAAGNNVKLWRYEQTYEWEEAQQGVSLTLINDRKYSIIFWAQNSSNTAYEISREGWITVDYTDYKTGGFAQMEELDAFCATQTITLDGRPQEPKQLTLVRRLAQLNIADDATEPVPGQHEAKITFRAMPTAYNPFTLKSIEEEVEDVTFTFTDFPDEALESKGKTYHYVTSNYVFLPFDGLIDIDYVLSEGGEIIKELHFADVGLEGNQRTNITGTVVQKPEAIWDGDATQEPKIENNCYVITCNEELAWLAENEATTTCIRFDADLNMGGNALGVLRILENTTIEGQNHTVKGLSLTSSLLRSTKNLTVTDLHISGATVNNGASASGTAVLVSAVSSGLNVSGLTFTDCSVSGAKKVGMLAGELKGSATIHNVNVFKAEKSDWGTSQLSADNGQGGGLIGYIGRVSEKERSETLSVTFDSCAVNDTYIKATGATPGNGLGKFVGTLSGYDYNEVLKFRDNCTTGDGTTLVSNYTSPYQEGNEGAWLAGNDYTAYSEWVGDEAYCRGIINFNVNELGTDSIQFIPKWDGVRSVEPLLANITYDGEDCVAGSHKYVVYSATDLAGVRIKTASPSAIYLKQNVDMFGQGEDERYNVPSNFKNPYSSTDDHHFNPFNYVDYLDGMGNSIYNLSIEQLENERAAFILYARNTTTHKNINFRNCQTVATHKVVQSDAKAYGAILVSNVDATYTMENVHAYDCKVFALQKVGTLGARISGTSTLKNNTVNNCYVENYECNITERFESGEKTIAGATIKNVQADFYPHGEVGGMYGFIQGNAALSDCYVRTSTIHAYGQDDKDAEMIGSGLLGWAAVGVAYAAGFYKVPGRHVGTLIGDIRATGTITINNCSTHTGTECTNRYDKHNNTYNYIGQAYYVQFLDSQGTVTVDGKPITLADCNRNTIL